MSNKKITYKYIVYHIREKYRDKYVPSISPEDYDPFVTYLEPIVEYTMEHRAVQWIQEEGEKQEDYVILKVYNKI